VRIDAPEAAIGMTRARFSTRVIRLLAQISQYFAGDDVFISYSRTDGVIYTQGLAAELARHGFSCRIDLYDTDTSADIPARLKNVTKSSYLLLVVGSPAACQSRFVQLEIQEFAATGRNFVVILRTVCDIQRIPAC
jgi:hypothetical protein